VLVIDDDEWVGRLLAVALRESGYEVIICASAVDGYEKAVEVQPDCIICDVDLPDVDGFWVARKIRMASSRVSVTPFLFLSGLDDRDTRIQGFHVGADVYMTKPFRIDEVVAQVGALVQMVTRLRQSRKSFLSVPPTDAAMVGDLSQMSIATVLTLLDMERRSGKLEISSKDEKATLVIVSGAITSATLGGDRRDPLELLRALLTWNSGRFAFRPDEAKATPAQDNSINALLMEAVRLEDETRASLLDPVELGPAAGRGAPVISSPPASDPMDSARISAALSSAFTSSPPPPPAATPPQTTPMTPKPAVASPTKKVSSPTHVAVHEKTSEPAPVATRAPSPLRSPSKPVPIAGASSKPAPPGRAQTPSPFAALRPTGATPAPPPAAATPAPAAVTPSPPPASTAPPSSSAPAAEDDDDSGWSVPPPSLDPDLDAVEDPPKPPPPPPVPGTTRPAPPRAPAARPLPNPRVGNGSGDK
jgi:CheY-like chemotaxis protein